METDVNIEKPIKIRNGYEMLRELCSFSCDFNSFSKNLNPITNRVQYIMHQLETNNIKFVADMYQPIIGTPDSVEGLPAEVNIVVQIEGIDKSITTVFSAHHDVNNMNSENCVDNTASVANLLDLCIQLSKEQPANNVVICFNDSEESVKPMACGIKRFSQNILKGIYGQVKYCVVLELTASGQNYWMSYYKENAISQRIREIHPNISRVRTPYSDNFVMEKDIINSVCIGSLNDVNLTQVRTRGFCYTWSLCHSIKDLFESQANEVDMNLFVTFLETLI
jgi:hypothetical protein